jgi:signal transduction histidine kinase
MRQILLNLVANAVKFTPSGGRVEIRASADADGFRVVVADTGIGMTAAEIDLALSAFGQVDATHSRRHEGTGLGLTLAKAMVELHHGTLTIESVQNRGTAVTVTLPPERMVDPKAIA